MTARAHSCVLRSLLILLFPTGLLGRPQGQTDLLQHYFGRPFLIREHRGLHEVVKINQRDADAYKGVYDKAVIIRSAKLAKETLQFDGADVGLVMASTGTPRGCEHSSPSSESPKKRKT